ncbi:hypothetical protein [Clostridium sp.]|uniref:hypothetical protein n=1 Tax=Clostridium sp. TaxID=1506 RepID=UPI002FCB84C0
MSKKKSTKNNEKFTDVQSPLKSYLPENRTQYSPHDLKSVAPNGDVTPLPNPAVDDIVSNNIATFEFDYTENMANAMEEYESLEYRKKK